MKTIIRNKSPKSNSKKYPYIGVADGCYVYFVSRNRGACLRDTVGYLDMGTFHADWNENLFIPFDGQITLENN
jgi:hypothetical protein